MFSGLVAGPSVRTAMLIGPNEPSPNASVSASSACRLGTRSGRTLPSGALKRTPSHGVPSATKSAKVGSATASGRRMTARARRAHGPCSFTRPLPSFRMASRFTREPSRLRRAGIRVMLAATAMETVTAPAMPMLRRIAKSKRASPARPSMTVTPEKKTARPAVATVRCTASPTAAPRPSSSRKRETSSSA